MVERLTRLENIDLNAVDDTGDTPITNAAEQGQVQMVHELLHAGVDVNSCNDEGETALIVAVYGEKIGVVERLLRYDGLDINAHDDQDNTALPHAALHDDVGIPVRLLSREQILINRPYNDAGTTPLMGATWETFDGCFEELIKDKRALPNQQDVHGRSAAHHLMMQSEIMSRKVARLVTEARRGRVHPELRDEYG